MIDRKNIPLLAVASATVTVLVVVMKTASAKRNRHKVSKNSFQKTPQYFSSIKRSIHLTNVRVPIANLVSSFSQDELSNVSDDEGLVDCDIFIDKDGFIAQVLLIDLKFDASNSNRSTSRFWTLLPTSTLIIDCCNCVVVPCFSDAHTHMVKTQTVPRNRNYSGTMTEASEAEAADVKRWWGDPGHVLRLMDFAARCALHHGTRAMRTHLDGFAMGLRETDPAVVDAVFDAFDTVRDRYAPDLSIQGVANLMLSLWLEDVPMATEFANRASQHTGVVLGAYVGNPPPDERPLTVKAMAALFQQAQRLSLDVDMHIDESADPSCCSLLALCDSLSTAREAGYQGKVVLGHCCALSLQDKKTQDLICQQLADLGDVYVVSNPFTNLGLQDRSGSGPPFSSVTIPVDVPRTPQWRGLTLLQELRAAGVAVASASDNVRDHWYPYGDYDMLSVWAQCQAIGHLDTAPCEGSWADLCTDTPAEAMRLPHSLSAGNPADLVLFPSSRSFSELFARPQLDRIILRRGKVQSRDLPDFCELDDLMAVKTERLDDSV